jgi:hypothetical protein
MGLYTRLRNHGAWIVAAFAATAIALAPTAGARNAVRATTSGPSKTKQCGGGSLCATTLSSPTPVASPPPPGARRGKPAPPRFSTVNVSATPQSTQAQIPAGSTMVEKLVTHRFVCLGYRRHSSSLFQFQVLSSAETSIVYEVSDTLHNTLPTGIHVCAGLPNQFTTLSGKPARQATLPDGTAGFVGLLPTCVRDSSGKIMTTGPCVSLIRGVHNPRNRTQVNTIIRARIPAVTQTDPWWGP